MILTQRCRIEPEFTEHVFALHMHVNWFVAVETVEEEPIRTRDSFDGGHIVFREYTTDKTSLKFLASGTFPTQNFHSSSRFIASRAVRSNCSGVMDTQPARSAPKSVPGSSTPVGDCPPIQ